MRLVSGRVGGVRVTWYIVHADEGRLGDGGLGVLMLTKRRLWWSRPAWVRMWLGTCRRIAAAVAAAAVCGRK